MVPPSFLPLWGIMIAAAGTSTSTSTYNKQIVVIDKRDASFAAPSYVAAVAQTIWSDGAGCCPTGQSTRMHTPLPLDTVPACACVRACVRGTDPIFAPPPEKRRGVQSGERRTCHLDLLLTLTPRWICDMYPGNLLAPARTRTRTQGPARWRNALVPSRWPGCTAASARKRRSQQQSRWGM